MIGGIGDFEIHEPLGHGGMGIVAKAWDPKLDRFVAIKMLLPELAAKQSARERFIREAKAAALVRHPNVVTVHSVDQAGQVPYFVMEFVQGATLQQLLNADHKPSRDQIIQWILDVVRGLAAAHKRDLIHRDIKPANVLIDEETNAAKLSDFGLVKALDDDSGLTASGTIAGTPEFMSPEQVESSSTIDARSDLFSLGALFYFGLSGTSPFRCDSVLATIRQVCDKQPAPLSQVAPDAPSWLAQIVGRLMKKDPRERYQNADDVIEAIDRGMARGTQQVQAAVGGYAKIALIAVVVVLLAMTLRNHFKPAADGFVVEGDSQTYNSLAEAIIHASSGGIILVRGNGEFLCKGVQLSDKSITLRAAPSSAPTLSLLSDVKLPLIASNGDLLIEGIRFKLHANDSTPASGPRTIVASQGGMLAVNNCEFEVHGQATAISISRDCALVNCRFEVNEGMGVNFFPSVKATATIQNCTFAGRHAIGLAATNEAAQSSELHIDSSTVRADVAVLVMGSMRINDAVRVFARNSNFESQAICSRYVTGRRLPSMRSMLRSMKSVISWREDASNRYADGCHYLQFSRKEGQSLDSIDNRADWTAYWNLGLDEASPDDLVGADESLVGVGGPFHARMRQDEEQPN